MEQLVSITALISSLAMILFASIAAAMTQDGKIKYPLATTAAWLLLSFFTLALAFLAGRIWP
jgi:hypothetical protein